MENSMGTKERLVVDLPSELVEAIRGEVKAGGFSSESEVIQAVLEAWRSEGVIEPDIETLRAFVAEGATDADAARFADADEMFARLRSRYMTKVADRSGG